MPITVEIRGLEEHQHPFYIIRYTLYNDQQELLTSVARYVHQPQRGKVQFLEPDLKKIHQFPNSMEQIHEIERVIQKEGSRLAELHGK